MTLISPDASAGAETAVLPPKGLLVREPWITMLVDGTKTWELRGSKTTHRGRAGLIAAGTGLVIGEARLVDVIGPLGTDGLESGEKFHRVAKELLSDRLTYAKTFAWVFEGAFRYRNPVPYTHPQGAVIWVRLPQRDITVR